MRFEVPNYCAGINNELKTLSLYAFKKKIKQNLIKETCYLRFLATT